MEVHIEFVSGPVPSSIPGFDERYGAVVEFHGVVRQEEPPIEGLEYECYGVMAADLLKKLSQKIGEKHPCARVTLLHSVGRVPVGQPSLWVCAYSKHRVAALSMVSELIEQMKQEAPIWKKKY